MARARAFKEELSTTSRLEEKIEAKEQDIHELKMSNRIKVIASKKSLLTISTFGVSVQCLEVVEYCREIPLIL